MKKWLVAALIGIACVVGVSFFLFRSTPVETVRAERKEIVERLVVTGQVVPPIRAEVSAEVSGRISRVAVRAGEVVEEGDILVELNAREAEASLRQAEATLGQAQARLRSVTRQEAPASLRDFEEAALNYEAALEEFTRTEELVREGVSTRAELDERRRAVERALLDKERAQLRMEQTSSSGSVVAETAAAVQQAQASRDLAAARLENHTVRAPFSGQVLRRLVDQGQSVQPGTILMAIRGEGSPEILIEPDEREVSNLKEGLSALVVADAFPEAVMEARIDRIAPSVDAARSTIRVYLELSSSPPEGLRTDMTVSADIELRRKENALVIAREAVRAQATGQPFALVIVDERAVRREVVLGMVGDDQVEIIEGLTEDEMVILTAEIEEGARISQ